MDALVEAGACVELLSDGGIELFLNGAYFSSRSAATALRRNGAILKKTAITPFVSGVYVFRSSRVLKACTRPSQSVSLFGFGRQFCVDEARKPYLHARVHLSLSLTVWPICTGEAREIGRACLSSRTSNS